jgi:hypothetical protein
MGVGTVASTSPPYRPKSGSALEDGKGEPDSTGVVSFVSIMSDRENRSEFCESVRGVGLSTIPALMIVFDSTISEKAKFSDPVGKSVPRAKGFCDGENGAVVSCGLCVGLGV